MGQPPTPAPLGQQQPQPPQEVYGVFCGSIDATTVQRILQNLTTATNPNLNITHAHILFQSSGGFIGDGVCLYNFLRTYPVPLTMYNVGSVQSAGTTAYLGARIRKASARAMFQIHRSVVNPQNATAAVVEGLTQSLSIEDARTEAIIREHVRMTEKQWALWISNGDVTFSGEEAVRVGMADEIGEFSPPAGKQIFYI